MINTDFVLALCIGLLVECAVYIGLRRALGGKDVTIRRTTAVFSAVAGIVVALFLWKNPSLLEQQSTKIVLALVGVVLTLIAVIRLSLR